MLALPYRNRCWPANLLCERPDVTDLILQLLQQKPSQRLSASASQAIRRCPVVPQSIQQQQIREDSNDNYTHQALSDPTRKEDAGIKPRWGAPVGRWSLHGPKTQCRKSLVLLHVPARHLDAFAILFVIACAVNS